MTEATAAAPATGTEPSTAAVAAPEATTATATPATVPAAAPTTAEAPQTPAATAPEVYDFKSAEGKVQPAVLAKFEGVARELGLSQEAAIKLIDSVGPEMANAMKSSQEAQIAKWAEDSKSDKEFGGEKLGENMAIAKKALDKFGSPELKDMLDKTGLGNHPELIRAFFRAGQQISSGSFVPSGQGQGGKVSAASKLYPSMKQA